MVDPVQKASFLAVMKLRMHEAVDEIGGSDAVLVRTGKLGFQDAGHALEFE